MDCDRETALQNAFNKFTKSGKVSDYLEFTALKNSLEDEEYAEHNPGTYNKIP